MRVSTDDDVYRVDPIWLGPKGFPLWWRARYSAYAIGFVLFFIAMSMQTLLGVHSGLWSAVWGVVAAVLLARLIGWKITFERPVAAVLVMFWRDVTAPRRSTAVRGLVTAPKRRRRLIRHRRQLRRRSHEETE